MAKKDLKKFCNLAKYIEQIDPQFYDAMDKLCATYLLKPPKGSTGITFFYPAEKAYRDKIINEAYGSHPEKSLAMMKSLVIRDNYSYPQNFDIFLVNALGQKIDVDMKDPNNKFVNLKNGLKVTRDEKFVPLDSSRTRVTVYTLSGKGEISIDGPAADIAAMPKKTGGSEDIKLELHDFLEKTFSGDMSVDNIYVKKVAVQLYVLDTHKADLRGKLVLTDYLGNDEFSDSYLLDIFCSTEFPRCASIVLEALKNDKKAMDATKEKYIELKKKAVGSLVPNVGNPSRLSKIKSPMEIRQRISDLYNGDEVRMGKDLFIVFCNVSRDIWQSEVSESGKIAAFKNFAYLASRVYGGCCKDILKHEFDIARDLTLYGNLLKSDVCLYIPQAEFGSSPLTELPSPLDMSEFSLSAFINKSIVTGGSNYDASLLDGF